MNSFNDSFRESFISLSTIAKIILLVFIIAVAVLLGGVLSVIAASLIYQMDFQELLQILSNPSAQNIHIVKFFQGVQSVGLFIIPAFLASFLFSRDSFRYLHISREPSVVTVLLVAFSIVAVIPFLNWTSEMNSRLVLPEGLNALEQKMKLMEEEASKLTKLFLVSHSAWDLLINFFIIAVLPAIGEEFLFRGVVQRLLGEWTKNIHAGILLSAFIFSFIHFQFYGFVPRFLLGLYFGYLMFWSKSVWVPVTAHLVNNGMAVVYYHFSKQPAGETALDTVGTESGSYLIYISAFITCLIVGMIYIREKEDGQLIRNGRSF